MLILKLNVYVTEVYSVRSGEREAHMVLFRGDCEGPYFQGTILPGGVDTQRVDKNGGTLSARYMLKGRDCEGRECSIFVENSAKMGEDRTVPTILTDSLALRWMETAQLYGKIVPMDEKLIIEIHCEDRE